MKQPLPEYRIGEKVPMPERKLEIRPEWNGISKSSFKPARKPK